MEQLSPEEQEALEEKRLQRVLSSPRNQAGGLALSPRKVDTQPVATKPAVQPASPRGPTGAIPAWKLQQLEREKAEQDRVAAEMKKKQEAASAIADRQAKQGIDADSTSDVPTYAMTTSGGSTSPRGNHDSPYATQSIIDTPTYRNEESEDERAKREEERLMKLIEKS